jgi:hypothetical protein
MLLAAVVCLAWQLLRLSDPYRTRPDDFISSWAAGRLLVGGENPYDAERVLAVQRTANWTKDIPYRIWYPPWAMPILGAFGLLPYATGRFLWYVISLGACLLSADLLWRYYDGPPRWRAVSWPLIFTFWPAVIDVRTGQISAFVLLGVAGFLFLIRERRWVAAGSCLPLVAIKPQLLHLFWIAVLLWVARERRWGVLLGAAGTTAALVLLAMAADPAIVPQFLYMATHEAPQAPASTLGTLLRAVVGAATGGEHFWLQFVPPVLSLVWFLPYWSRHRGEWRWETQAPILLLVSLATTAYGWIYDQMVLLVPVVQIATVVIAAGRLSIRSRAVAGYIAVNGAILAMNVAGVGAFWYIWVPFGFAAWWLLAREEIVTEMPAIAGVRLPSGGSVL